MAIKSALRSAGILASIFLISLFAAKPLSFIDSRFYDLCLNNNHDTVYGGNFFLPSLKLLVYTEATSLSVGGWTANNTRQLESFLRQSGVKATVFYPGAEGELEPATSSNVFSTNNPPAAKASIRDTDGKCRRVALALKKDGRWEPTMPLRIVAMLSNAADDSIAYLPSEIVVGQRRISTDANYQILVRFRRSEETTSANEADNQFEQMVPISIESLDKPEFQSSYAKRFRGNVILVGTGLKAASERALTPLGYLQDYKIDACTVETVLGNWQIETLSQYQRTLLTLAAVLFFHSVLARLPILGIGIFWLTSQMGWLYLNSLLFAYSIFVGYTPILIPSLLTAVFVTATKLQQASIALRRFGGAGAYEAGQRGDQSIFEEVREKTATIVFTNVLACLKELERQGSPDEFFERRQAYAQLLSDVFRKHKGVVLDYQGDFQMVGFNVELRLDDENHPANALAASWEFLDRLPEVTKSWEANGVKIGTAHCGICTGPVACGHVGSRRHDGGRIAQAAIGDTSNVAARLLGAAMKQKEPILVAMTTVEASNGAIDGKPLEAIALKGKAEAVAVARPSRLSK